MLESSKAIEQNKISLGKQSVVMKFEDETYVYGSFASEFFCVFLALSKNDHVDVLSVLVAVSLLPLSFLSSLRILYAHRLTPLNPSN